MMDWKTKVLFVLVLFGSVVPVSARTEPAGGMTAEVWAIISVGAVLLGVILSTWMTSRADNRKAHEKIGKNINKIEENLKADIDKVEGNLREDVRESEKRVNENINKVHGDVRLC